jgi:hypothetical protein
MLLQDLPEKTFHRLLKSVTWTEVDGAFPIKHWLRRFISRVSQTSRRVMSVRTSNEEGMYHGKALARKRKSVG